MRAVAALQRPADRRRGLLLGVGAPSRARVRRSSAGRRLYDLRVQLARHEPVRVRIGFILCGVVATVLAAKTATRLAGGDPRAGAVTALAITLTPLSSVAFGSASPDGPYLAAWAASLYCAVRAFETRARRDYVWLGVALGAVLLTRIFAFALVFGIVDVRARAGPPPPLARRAGTVVSGRRRDVRAVLGLELDPRLGDLRLRAGRAGTNRNGSGTARSRCISSKPRRIRPVYGSAHCSASSTRATRC